MPDKSEINVVIYRTGGIGDVVLSTVSLNYIYQLDQAINIYWVSFNPILEFIKGCHPSIIPIEIHRKNSYKENFAKLISDIPEADVVIDLQRSLRSILLCRRLAIKLNATYHTWNKGSIRRTKMVVAAKFTNRNIINSALLKDPKPRYKEMLSCTIKALAPYSNVKIVAYPELKVPTNNPLPFKDISNDILWVGIGAGGLHDIKWAPETFFSKVLTDLTNSHSKQIGFIFLGDKYDKEYAENIIRSLNDNQKVINYCGNLSLVETAFVLNKCSIVLSNDTALAHMAEALSKDVAMLYGPTVEAFGYAPFRKSSQSFSSNIGCRPCTKSGDSTCRYNDKLCFERIKKQEVTSYLINKIIK